MTAPPDARVRPLTKLLRVPPRPTGCQDTPGAGITIGYTARCSHMTQKARRPTERADAHGSPRDGTFSENAVTSAGVRNPAVEGGMV